MSDLQIDSLVAMLEKDITESRRKHQDAQIHAPFIITISRQHGSEGDTIGKILSEYFSIPLNVFSGYELLRPQPCGSNVFLTAMHLPGKRQKPPSKKLILFEKTILN